jgi:hypothetical protein
MRDRAPPQPPCGASVTPELCDCCGALARCEHIEAIREGSPVYLRTCGACRRIARLTGKFMRALLEAYDAHAAIGT